MHWPLGDGKKQTREVDPIKGFAWDKARHLFDSNMDRLEEFLNPALQRLPVLNELGHPHNYQWPDPYFTGWRTYYGAGCGA